MSNKISRRTFLKCTGASAAALGAAAMLGGCGSSTSDAIEVKVGDKVSNWNGLGVQLTSLFNIDTAPAHPRWWRCHSAGSRPAGLLRPEQQRMRRCT